MIAPGVYKVEIKGSNTDFFDEVTYSKFIIIEIVFNNPPYFEDPVLEINCKDTDQECK